MPSSTRRLGIGKAGMLGARAVVNGALDSGWMDKRLHNHVWKLMWGVWSPSLSGKMIDMPAEERWHRVQKRNAEKGKTYQLGFEVTREMFQTGQTRPLPQTS